MIDAFVITHHDVLACALRFSFLAMDITSAFIACLRSVQAIDKSSQAVLSEESGKTATPSTRQASTLLLAPLRPRLATTDPFTQQARDVVASLKEKERMLSKCRADYVDVHR